MVRKSPHQHCSRPYNLGQRAAAMDRNRARIVEAARDLLLQRGLTDFSMEAVARQAGLTRQTVHNQFGTRSVLLEALCDHMAHQGGMEGIAAAFQEGDPAATLRAFIGVFARFWSADRALTRRIHGLVAVDSDLEQVLAGRQQRRMMGSRKIVSLLSRRTGHPVQSEIETAARSLWALTSFEFFDALAGPDLMPDDVAPVVVRLASSLLRLS